MDYDPRKCGAKCDQCPLGPNGDLRDRRKPWKPVPPEKHKDNATVVVSDMPSQEDVKYGHPFASADTGGPWQRLMWNIKKSREDYDITNVIMCASAGNSSGMIQRLDDKHKRLNKARELEGLSPVPHPIDCCAPRLKKELKNYKNIVTLGKTANKAVTGVNRGIDKVRASPWGLTEDWVKKSWDDPEVTRYVLPTFNPRRIGRNPIHFDRWRLDFLKAERLFTKTLDWDEPAHVLWRPSADELEAWFKGVKPTLHKKRRGKNRRTKAVVCGDVETPRHPQGLRPREVHTRTISYARWKNGVEDGDIELCCISLISTDGHTRFYSEVEEERIRQLIREFHDRDDILFIGHNWLSFDCPNIEANDLGKVRHSLDTLGPARAANPSISKGLKPTGRTYCDVSEWDSDDKEESIATGSTNDDELLTYNGTDVHVNLKIFPTLKRLAAAAGYFKKIRPELLDLGWWPYDTVPSLCDIDMWRQDRAIRCTEVGLWIDQEKRKELEKDFTKQYELIYDRIQKILADEGVFLDQKDLDELNPNSTQNLRWLYFDKWELPPLWNMGYKDDDGTPLYKKKDFVTNNGDLSTGDIVHRHYLASGILTERQAELMQLVRVFRRIRGKIVGTTLKPLAPAAPVYNKKGELTKHTKSFLYPDGRIHSKFSTLITSVNRWNSSGPNTQNIGNKKGQGPLKKVFAAPPGRFFVGADINQAHLFIIANVWKIPALCEAIRKGYDPHNYNAYTTFGKKFENAQGYNGLKQKPDPGSPADSMRNVIKVFIYASVYGASPLTVHSVLASTEFDLPEHWMTEAAQGNIYDIIRKTMPYLKMKPSEVKALHKAWLKGQPEWLDAWQKEIDFYKAHGYVQSYLFNRQSGDLGDDQNKMVNTGVLTTEGEVMMMIEGRIEAEFPRDGSGPGTGLLWQCHDSAVIEWALPPGFPPFWHPGKGYKRADLPPEIRDIEERFEEAFTVKIPGWEFPIRGEASVGRTLKEVS